MKAEGKLFSHTLILGVGSVISKTVSFFLLPLYTLALSPAEFGTADIFVNTAVLLLPLVSLHAPEAVFRFRAAGERGAFGVGLIFLGIGLSIFSVFLPFFSFSRVLRPYLGLLYAYVSASVLRSYLAHTLRADGAFGLFALQQVFCALLTALLQYLLLFVWHLGIAGYLLGVILADATTFLLLLLCLLGRWWQKEKVTRTLYKKMLRYSLPLIPTAALWWVMAASDRFFILRILGESETGIYAAAGRLPTLLSFIVGVFLEAWHYAFLRTEAKERGALFGRIYGLLFPVLLTGGALLCIGNEGIVALLFSKSYAGAARYVPLLLVGAVCGGLANFLDSVYVLFFKTNASFFTALAASGSNLLLNFFLIPTLGAIGAAIATAVSYGLLFLLRYFHTRRYLVSSVRTVTAFLPFACLFLGGLAMGYGYRALGVLLEMAVLALSLPGTARAVRFLWKRGMILLNSFKKTQKKQEKI